jgi:hypothetical protein
MKELIFIGSSFTQGAGLGYSEYVKYLENRNPENKLYNSDEKYSRYSKYAFPNLIATELNLPFKNWGVSGKGLSYVMRRVYQSNKINKDTMFILEFPPGPRFEIYHPKIDKYIVPSMTDDMKNINYLDDDANGFRESLSEDIELLMRMHLLQRNFKYEHTIQTYQFISMVEFLKKHSNVIVLFGEHPDANYNTDEIVHKYILDDIVDLGDGYINFVNWANETGKTITADTNGKVEDAHFSYYGHKLVSEKIINKIEDLQLKPKYNLI